MILTRYASSRLKVRTKDDWTGGRLDNWIDRWDWMDGQIGLDGWTNGKINRKIFCILGYQNLPMAVA